MSFRWRGWVVGASLSICAGMAVAQDETTAPADAAASAAAEPVPADAAPVDAPPPAEAASQAAAAPAETPPAVEDSGVQTELPDMVVTAQKMKQTMQEVPAAVSAIDGEAIKRTGAKGFDQVADYLPNISISLGHASGTFAIRGFATPDTNPGFDPSVGTVVDGVFYGRPQFLSAFFHDIDRFEVLRGPQGTLFGKNATAGLVNLTTREPEPDFHAGADMTVYGYGQRDLQAMLNAPIGGEWSARLSADFNHDNGPLYNTDLDRHENGTDEQTVRVRLRYAPPDGANVVLTAFQSKAHMNNNEFEFTRLTPDMLHLIQSYDPRANAVQGDNRNSANFHSQQVANIQGVALTFDQDLGDHLTFSSVTGAARSVTDSSDLDADFSPVPFIDDTLAEPKIYQQLSQELRVSGKQDDIFGWGYGVNFVAGLYAAITTFQTSDIFAVEDLGAALQYCSATPGFCGVGLPTPPGTGTIGTALGGVLDPALIVAAQGLGPQNAQVRLHQHSPTYAAFGQFEHFLLPEWALIGGIRWGLEEKGGDFHSHSNSQLIKQIADQEDFDTKVSRAEHDLSPKFGLKWMPNRDVNFYGTWTQGYKSGGFNGLPLNPADLEYDPETATSIEFGAKAQTDFLGGPIRVNAAFYNTDFDNLQVSTFRGGSFVVLNAASARSRGGEIDARWSPPVPGFYINSSVGYADAYYTSYPDAPAIADSGADTQDLGGKRLSLAPRWTGSFVPVYQQPLGDNWAGGCSVEFLYKSWRYLDVDDDPRKVQDATTVVNANVTISRPSAGVVVTLGGHNLTDELIYDQIINQPLAPGNFAGVRVDRGRYWTMNISVAL